ncbi:MAG: hypothetical protein AAF844_12140 [Pseudomonadota bacterium]
MLGHRFDVHILARASAAPRWVRLASSTGSKDNLPCDPARLSDVASSGYRRPARLSLQAMLELLRVVLDEIGERIDRKHIRVIIV